MNVESAKEFISAYDNRREQHDHYVTDRLVNGTVATTDTLFPLFLPPALSDQGKQRSGKKSDILDCLDIPKVNEPSRVTVKVEECSFTWLMPHRTVTEKPQLGLLTVMW